VLGIVVGDPRKRSAFVPGMMIRERVLSSEDAKEGSRSFVERREARFSGR
jgi:hypothetical protein